MKKLDKIRILSATIENVHCSGQLLTAREKKPANLEETEIHS